MMNTLDSKINISDRGSNEGLDITSKFNSKIHKRVYVGMSGGVDSSVSAYLLKQQGYDVTGVFIKVWQPDNTDCGWKDERRDAMRVAAVLDIPFVTLDFSDVYKKEVVDYMIEEYKVGRTPNPDIMCNRHVKFGSFLEYALSQGVEYVATGHYAQNLLGNLNSTSPSDTHFFSMTEGADSNKDQSYFLWTLTQEDLKHILFPIGHLQKSEVRKIAEKAGLPVFDKKDSQGVCFIGHLDMKNFLKEYIETSPGDVLDVDGTVIGTHDGAELYTIGERHGFTLHTKSAEYEPHFIVSKDIHTNTITVLPKSTYESTLNLNIHYTEIKLTNTSFSQNIDAYTTSNLCDANESNKKDIRIEARIRYRQEKQSCTLFKVSNSTKDLNNISSTNEYRIRFDSPQKGMAEGQSVVLYDGNVCLGGGILNFI